MGKSAIHPKINPTWTEAQILKWIAVYEKCIQSYQTQIADLRAALEAKKIKQ